MTNKWIKGVTEAVGTLNVITLNRKTHLLVHVVFIITRVQTNKPQSFRDNVLPIGFRFQNVYQEAM